MYINTSIIHQCVSSAKPSDARTTNLTVFLSLSFIIPTQLVYWFTGLGKAVGYPTVTVYAALSRRAWRSLYMTDDSL